MKSPAPTRVRDALRSNWSSPARSVGSLKEVRGETLTVALPKTELGALLEISIAGRALFAVVIGFSDSHYIAAPFERPFGAAPGDRVVVAARSVLVRTDAGVLGSVIGPLGEELERVSPSQASPESRRWRSPHATPFSPLHRPLLRRRFETGIRAIDAFVPLAFGQRMVVFAEPGVGKSSLMECVLKAPYQDANVVALVGERAREVNECIHALRSSDAAPRTVVVVATSDQPAIARVHAAWTAASIAEDLRERGSDALLVVDSITRFCRALRELGATSGEPPLRRGYAGSVYSRLAEFIERSGAGANTGGSITALYTALLTGELEEDPMTEEIRSLCDGHLILSRPLAEAGHFPAVDILRSLSRLSGSLHDREFGQHISRLRAMLATIDREADAVSLGAAPSGAYLAAKAIEAKLNEFLKQSSAEYSAWPETERLAAALIP